MVAGNGEQDELLSLESIERCFTGAVPAVLATASGDGVPNVTFLSRAHRVDSERVALSNQFMSKTSRNLAANPRASLLLIDPLTHDEYRLSLVFERTERRGHVFEHLRTDVDAIATVTGMQGVFRLRAADIFRVVDLVHVPPNPASIPSTATAQRSPSIELTSLVELSACLGRADDLEVLLDTALEGLDRLLGYRHVHLLLLDEEGRHLYTIASRGFDAESIGAQVAVGEGILGMAAERCATVNVGNLMQLAKYSRSVRAQFEGRDDYRLGSEAQVPGLPNADSRIAVPVKALGELVGVLAVDSSEPAAFDAVDEQLLAVVAALLASTIARLRTVDDEEPPSASHPVANRPLADVSTVTTLRFFDVDGSTFLDGDYLIKGVAGRILRSLMRQYLGEGRVEFTNREVRLDPSLDMPGFKDNFESRLILLKRRLDERGAPFRIERIGRGRFRLDVTTTIQVSDVTGR